MGKLAPHADRTTDPKRLKRVKQRLDEKRSVKGLLDLPAWKPKEVIYGGLGGAVRIWRPMKLFAVSLVR